MFTMQKMCQQRAFDMTRDDERMAMLRKKQEIEERFGTPRSSRKLKYVSSPLFSCLSLLRSSRPFSWLALSVLPRSGLTKPRV
jgi:hypothetical protein